MVQAIGTIVSRNHDGRDDLVISVTQIHAGTVSNVIPETAYINATVRTLDKDVQDMVMRRLQEVVDGTAAAFGVTASLTYDVGYPATINDASKAAFAAEVAAEVAGADNVATDAKVEMGAEDFAYFLQERPGAYLFVGNGDTAGLHHPAYDFDDETAASGASFFARIVERAQPVNG